MTEPDEKPEKPARAPTPPDAAPACSPWLAVADVAAAASFLVRGLAFELVSEQLGPEGKPFHAVLRYRDARVQLGPEGGPGGDLRSPKSRGGATMYHYLSVDRVDSAYERALDEGAMPIRAPRNEFWGDRCALVADRDGHLWMLAQRIPGHDAWKEARQQISDQKKLTDE